ncbi:MAG: hypothetical protein PHH13_01970 [Candidatus Peribacteraceae bacterium]|nr:hypothetical protein [Candidatus Peribacteraceae bacterium]
MASSVSPADMSNESHQMPNDNSEKETVRYGHVYAWAKELGMSPTTMGKRLKEAEGVEGVTAKGKIVLAYEEDEVRRICHDLLGTVRTRERAEADFELARKILGEAGYPTKHSLISASPSEFVKTDFGPFGKGAGLCSKILRRSVAVTSEVLSEVGTALWPDAEAEDDVLRREYLHVLTENSYPDRLSLIHAMPTHFAKQTFGRFGRGHGFCSHVLGESTYPTTIILRRVADKVWPVSEQASEELLNNQYRVALIEAGYPDRKSLEQASPAEFKRKQFGSFGKGSHFCSLIFGKTTHVTSTSLHAIAEKYFPSTHREQDERQMMFDEMMKAGYSNRNQLLHAVCAKFEQHRFGDFGQGIAYANRLLKHKVTGVSRSILREMADIYWPISGDEKEHARQGYIQALAAAGYPTRESLLRARSRELTVKDFGIFGKAGAFCAHVLGRYLPQARVTKEVLQEVAQVLWPLSVEEERALLKQQYITALATCGYPSRESLVQASPQTFTETQFGSFGGGRAFMGRIVGRTLRSVRIETLREASSVLWGPEQDDSLCPQADSSGYFILDDTRYANIETWARDLGMPHVILKRRLTGIKGITGRTKRGPLMSDAFFSESVIQKVCEDVLQRPQADEKGFYSSQSGLLGTKKAWSAKLEIDYELLRSRIEQRKLQGIPCKTHQGRCTKELLYSEQEILALCKDIMDTNS